MRLSAPSVPGGSRDGPGGGQEAGGGEARPGALRGSRALSLSRRTHAAAARSRSPDPASAACERVSETERRRGGRGWALG